MSNPPNQEFSSLTSRQQIGRVRCALSARLASTNQADAPLAFASNSFNITFKLEGAETVAVRVNINSRRTEAEIRGEQALLHQIGKHTTLRVPEPVGIFNGEAMAQVDVAGMDRPCLAIAYTWLPGRHGQPAARTWEMVGDALRQMHAATMGFDLPPKCERPLMDDVLDGLPWSLKAPECAEALSRAQEVMHRLHQRPRQLVHFDLHVWNTKFDGERLAVFDFDDAVWSCPATDVAQALYYVRRSPNPAKSERAFWKGLRATPESLGTTPDEIEALIMGRNLLLACDLAINVSAGSAQELAGYVETVRLRAAHYLATGTFDGQIVAP